MGGAEGGALRGERRGGGGVRGERRVQLARECAGERAEERVLFGVRRDRGRRGRGRVGGEREVEG